MTIYHLAFALATTLSLLSYAMFFHKGTPREIGSGKSVRMCLRNIVKSFIDLEGYAFILGIIALIALSPWAIAIAIVSYFPITPKALMRLLNLWSVMAIATLVYAYGFYLIDLCVRWYW